MTTQITKSVLCYFAVIQVLLILNNHKNLDVSCKMDLDFWDCFGRKKKLCLITEEISITGVCLHTFGLAAITRETF